MGCSPPDFCVRGISEAGILEWVTVSSSRDPLDPRTGSGSPTSQADSLPSEPPGTQASKHLCLATTAHCLDLHLFLWFPCLDQIKQPKYKQMPVSVSWPSVGLLRISGHYIGHPTNFLGRVPGRRTPDTPWQLGKRVWGGWWGSRQKRLSSLRIVRLLWEGVGRRDLIFQ